MIATHLLIISMLIAFSHTTDYCKRELCPSSGHSNHIGCGNNGNFGPKCPKDRSIEPMTPERISLLLKTHNQLRSDIANGRVPPYSQADQMIELRLSHVMIKEWNHELAQLAEMNVKSCVFDHDECRNTDLYPLAGQNIHYLWIKGKQYDNIETFLVDGTNKWFIEHKMCDMSYINKYRRPDKNIGHFCQVAKDTADRVGCAVVKYDDGSKKHMILTCNYSVGTVLDNPIYTTGSPCSKCMSGCSNVYRGLCTSNEKSFWVNGVSRNRY